MLERKRLIKVVLETVKGTFVAPTQALKVFDLDCNTMTEHAERSGTGTGIGHEEEGDFGHEIGFCRFRAELRSDGTAHLEAGLAILLQGCGALQATDNYTLPTSVETNQKTISIAVYEDGKMKSLAGCMGKWTLEANIPGKAVYINFDFSGKWIAPVDAAIPAYAPSTTKRMKMTAFTVGGAPKKIARYFIDGGQNVVPWPDPNGTGQIASFLITSSMSSLEIDPDAALVATWDLDGLRRAKTKLACVATFSDGTDTITITTPVAEITGITDGDRGGIWAAKLKCNLLKSSGEDAITIAA